MSIRTGVAIVEKTEDGFIYDMGVRLGVLSRVRLGVSNILACVVWFKFLLEVLNCLSIVFSVSAMLGVICTVFDFASLAGLFSSIVRFRFRFIFDIAV